jgi:hypothetical protein
MRKTKVGEKRDFLKRFRVKRENGEGKREKEESRGEKKGYMREK